MQIAELDISGSIEFEGVNYRYWEFEVDDIVVKVAEFALQKAFSLITRKRNTRALRQNPWTIRLVIMQWTMNQSRI